MVGVNLILLVNIEQISNNKLIKQINYINIFIILQSMMQNNYLNQLMEIKKIQ